MNFKTPLLLLSALIFAVPSVSQADLLDSIVKLDFAQAERDIAGGAKLDEVYNTWGKRQTPFGFAIYMASLEVNPTVRTDRLTMALLMLQNGADLEAVKKNPGDEWIFEEQYGGPSLIRKSPALFKVLQDKGYLTK